MDFGGGASSAASAASSDMSNAIYAAIAEEKAARDQARADIQPWRQAGGTALNTEMGLLGQPGYASVDPSVWQNTPGFQEQMKWGINALDRSAASRGLLTSGAQQKGLLQYGQGLANQTYMQDYFNPIQQMNASGQNAAAQQGQTSMQAANNIGNLYGQLGQTQANAALASYGANQQSMGNMFGGLLNLAGMGVGLYTGAPALFGNA